MPLGVAYDPRSHARRRCSPLATTVGRSNVSPFSTKGSDRWKWPGMAGASSREAMSRRAVSFVAGGGFACVAMLSILDSFLKNQ
jgi:hypothetical protein